MADTKISELGELAELDDTADEFVVVDKTDTAQGPTGTTKRVTVETLDARYTVVEDVTTATLLNDWAPSGSLPAPGYYKHRSRVYFAGIASGLAPATDVHAFTLPSGYRPAGTIHLDINYWDGVAWTTGVVEVTTAGAVRLNGNAWALDAQDFYNLDGLSFRI